jgi:hypothetical protein
MDIDERPFKRESGSDNRPGFPIKSTRYSLGMETKQSQELINHRLYPETFLSGT